MTSDACRVTSSHMRGQTSTSMHTYIYTCTNECKLMNTFMLMVESTRSRRHNDSQLHTSRAKVTRQKSDSATAGNDMRKTHNEF